MQASTRVDSNYLFTHRIAAEETLFVNTQNELYVTCKHNSISFIRKEDRDGNCYAITKIVIGIKSSFAPHDTYKGLGSEARATYLANLKLVQTRAASKHFSFSPFISKEAAHSLVVLNSEIDSCEGFRPIIVKAKITNLSPDQVKKNLARALEICIEFNNRLAEWKGKHLDLDPTARFRQRTENALFSGSSNLQQVASLEEAMSGNGSVEFKSYEDDTLLTALVHLISKNKSHFKKLLQLEETFNSIPDFREHIENLPEAEMSFLKGLLSLLHDVFLFDWEKRGKKLVTQEEKLSHMLVAIPSIVNMLGLSNCKFVLLNYADIFSN